MVAMTSSSRRRNVLPPTREGTISDLHDNHQHLKKYIRDHTFTPVLGAECSTIGREDTEAWKQIGTEFDRLILDPRMIEEEEQDYLISLAKQKGVPLSRDDDSVGMEGKHPGELHELRRVLLRLALKAGALFGRGMSQSVEAVTDAVHSRVRPEAEYKEFREVLILACIQAHLVQSRRIAQLDTMFAAHGIYDRLIELTAQLVCGWISPDSRRRLRSRKEDQEALHSVFGRLGIPYNTPANDAEPVAPYLYLYQLEWIADLLWYTFRFDAHAYPTIEELTFQVSLGVRHSDQRPEFASAAELQGSIGVERLRRWFGRYRTQEKPRNRVGQFYDAVARVLIGQFHAAVEPSMSPHDPLDAVAFSTTFDTELEEALLRAPGVTSVHVAVPVLARTRGEPEETRYEWLLGSLIPGDSADTPRWEWFPDTSSAVLPLSVKGPLVVKLHGSPLTQLPSLAELEVEGVEETYISIEHALTASESQHLQNIVLLDAMPEYVHAAFRNERRTFFLLGQSVGDWSVKLRLFDIVYPRRMNPPTPRRMIAINAQFDPYRSSLLDALGIDRWRGPLDQLTELVEDVTS